MDDEHILEKVDDIIIHNRNHEVNLLLLLLFYFSVLIFVILGIYIKLLYDKKKSNITI